MRPAILGGAAAWLRRDWLALVLFAALSLAVSYPTLASPRALITGVPGDNIQYVYITGWVAQALLLGEVPFIDPRLNFPDQLYLTTTDVPLLSQVALAPASWLLGPVFGYNLMVLAASLLSGYLMYLWARSLTGSALGGLIAGMLLLLAPYRVVHSQGHPALMSLYVAVLFFWALDHALRAPRPAAPRLVLLGFATAAVGLTAQYYVVICLVCGAAYALLRLWGEPRAAGPFALSVGCGTLISMIPSLMAVATGSYAQYSIQDEMRVWSLDPLSFFLPAGEHPLWGGLFQRLHPLGSRGEQTMYLGLVALALAGVGLAGGRRRGLPVGVWLGVALVAAVMALGTDLHLSGEPLSAERPLWLPAYYLANLPLISLVRVWSRFGMVTLLFVALLAGVGAAELGARARRPALLGAALGALVLLDFLPGAPPVTRLAPRPIEAWLAAQPGDFAVAFLPPGEVNPNYRAMYGSLFHGKHMPAFNHPEHRPPAYLDFQRRADKFPDRDSLDALRALGLRYLLVERAAYDGQRWPAWDAVAPILDSYPDVGIVGEEGGVVIVELR